MKKNSLRKRFRYWLDRRMAKGTSSMVKLLVFAVLGAVLVVSALVMAFGLHKDGKSFIAVLWDNMRSAMSSSFPSSESGTLLYIVLYTFLGLVGMVFTGMLIGIFSSTIRGKLLALQKENSPVLEKNHRVILGFRYGEYVLLEQMIAAAGKEKRTIVIAENLERTDMELAVRENVKVPRNIRLLFRNVDITNPRSLECCSLEECDTIVLQAKDKGVTIKSLLAIRDLLKDVEEYPDIIVSVDSDTEILPDESLAKMNVHMLYSRDVVARIIARAATQPGVFDAFMDMISFSGHEFYFESLSKAEGLTYGQVVLSAEYGIVAGLYRDGKTMLNPDPSLVIEADDLFIVFEEEEEEIRLKNPQKVTVPEQGEPPALPMISEVVVIGANKGLTTILRELPDNIRRIRLAGTAREKAAAYLPAPEELPSEIVYDANSVDNEYNLLDVVKEAPHLIVLSDRNQKPDEADTETLLRLMRLRDIKSRYSLPFTITVEMQRETNRRLVEDEKGEDFVVATDLSSMILAQITEDVRRIGLFTDLLDEEGAEVYLKSIGNLGLVPCKISSPELRDICYAMGYVLIGVRTAEQQIVILDEPRDLDLTADDRLILIGEA